MFIRKRVPARYAPGESRRIVHLTLHTDSMTVAKQKAPVIWAEMIEAWEAKLKGDSEDAAARFAVAGELAHVRGFRYLHASAVARLPIPEILERVEAAIHPAKAGGRAGSARG